MPVTRAAENSTPRAMNIPARYQPGARSCAVIDVPSSSCHLVKVLHERVELLGLQRLLEVRGHDVAEALRDLGARVDDALLDERGVLVGERLVQVRPGSAGRAGVGERVAAPAAVVREERLAVGRAGVLAGL